MYDPFENSVITPLIYPNPSPNRLHTNSDLESKLDAGRTGSTIVFNPPDKRSRQQGNAVAKRSKQQQRLSIEKTKINERGPGIAKTRAHQGKEEQLGNTIADKRLVEPGLIVPVANVDPLTSKYQSVLSVVEKQKTMALDPGFNKTQANLAAIEKQQQLKKIQANNSTANKLTHTSSRLVRVMGQYMDDSNPGKQVNVAASIPLKLSPETGVKENHFKPIGTKHKNKSNPEPIKLVIGRLKVDVVPVNQLKSTGSKRVHRHSAQVKAGRKKNKSRAFQNSKMDFGVGQM